MKLQQQQALEAVLSGPEAAAEPAQAQQAKSTNSLGLAGQFQTKAATVAKLLATEQRFSMLPKAEYPLGGAGGSPYLYLAGSSLTALQVLERGTAGVLLQALLANNAVLRNTPRSSRSNAGAPPQTSTLRTGWQSSSLLLLEVKTGLMSTTLVWCTLQPPVCPDPWSSLQRWIAFARSLPLWWQADL